MFLETAIAKHTLSLELWERLHGLWRTLPNFNPFTVSSEPGQRLDEDAQDLLFPSHTGAGSGEDTEEGDPMSFPGAVEHTMRLVDYGSDLDVNEVCIKTLY